VVNCYLLLLRMELELASLTDACVCRRKPHAPSVAAEALRRKNRCFDFAIESNELRISSTQTYLFYGMKRACTKLDSLDDNLKVYKDTTTFLTTNGIPAFGAMFVQNFDITSRHKQSNGGITSIRIATSPHFHSTMSSSNASMSNSKYSGTFLEGTTLPKSSPRKTRTRSRSGSRRRVRLFFMLVGTIVLCFSDTNIISPLVLSILLSHYVNIHRAKRREKDIKKDAMRDVTVVDFLVLSTTTGMVVWSETLNVNLEFIELSTSSWIRLIKSSFFLSMPA